MMNAPIESGRDRGLEGEAGGGVEGQEEREDADLAGEGEEYSTSKDPFPSEHKTGEKGKTGKT
jgi:hypothetical protein